MGWRKVRALWTETGKKIKAVEVSWMDEREKEMGGE